ncbi:hypothetical protein L0636_01160 [Halomonas janggokensis]|uniref:Uncharacterized protein n=1 Tax=Vreelandella janggokensis TaxID=370767 RepID=A0ABT4IU24_9GAMM|nr:hypothetical protein [Halomonas janggokensis]MCZ0926497.1 hypothetical protein [Halomonas janggokensis]MCZ0929035.1 hypothetical protein [Halomonas janggokensis]
MIQPKSVQRDEYGQWTHPDFEAFLGDREAVSIYELTAWLSEHRLEFARVELEHTDDEAAIDAYYEQDNPDLSAWKLHPPSDAPWFLLSIFDHEDGPCQLWAKRIKQPLTLNRHRKASPLIDIRIGWRPVSDRRARKLRKRGERVQWKESLASMAWLPGDEELEEGLPEGIVISGGEYEAECCRCGQWKPIPCDLSEIPHEGYEHYCGGSPMCCP